MDAWLITWESANDPDERIAGFLPAALSPEEVVRFVEHAYAHHTYTLTEQANYLAGATVNPYRARVQETAPGYHRIDRGDNPWLSARRVRNLTVRERDDDDHRLEDVTWEECTSSWEWKTRRRTQRWHAPTADAESSV